MFVYWLVCLFAYLSVYCFILVPGCGGNLGKNLLILSRFFTFVDFITINLRIICNPYFLRDYTQIRFKFEFSVIVITDIIIITGVHFCRLEDYYYHQFTCHLFKFYPLWLFFLYTSVYTLHIIISYKLHQVRNLFFLTGVKSLEENITRPWNSSHFIHLCSFVTWLNVSERKQVTVEFYLIVCLLFHSFRILHI